MAIRDHPGILACRPNRHSTAGETSCIRRHHFPPRSNPIDILQAGWIVVVKVRNHRTGATFVLADPTLKPCVTMVELSPPVKVAPTLLSAPIELAGNWGHMLPRSANLVLERMRHSCLDGVRLVSDRQPTRLRVDEHTSGPPAVWLHPDGSSMAWIIVDIGERAWSQLAYQFGHELGHVLANSWQPHAKPKGPCQWLEEAMVEAFSLRGLSRLAESWRVDPPFPKDNEFGTAIADYRQNIIQRYTGLVPIQDYLRQWEASCAELQVSPALPTRLREILQLA
jgi:hypothetical protein